MSGQDPPLSLRPKQPTKKSLAHLVEAFGALKGQLDEAPVFASDVVLDNTRRPAAMRPVGTVMFVGHQHPVATESHFLELPSSWVCGEQKGTGLHQETSL